MKDAPLDGRSSGCSACRSGWWVWSVGGLIALLGMVPAAPALAPLARLDATSFSPLPDGHRLHRRAAGRAVRAPADDQPVDALRRAAAAVRGLISALDLDPLLIGYLHWGVSAIFLANLHRQPRRPRPVPEGDPATFFRPTRLAGAEWGAPLEVRPADHAGDAGGDAGGERRPDRARLPARERGAGAVYAMSSKDVVGIYSFNYKLGVAMLLVVQMFRMAWTPFSLQHAHGPLRPAALLAGADRADARLRGGVPRGVGAAPLAGGDPRGARLRESPGTGWGCPSCR